MIENNKPARIILITLVVIAAIGITWHFLSQTPGGCYAKITAVGSSLCHQIPTHSYILNGVQFPICARCTGLYLGSFIGLTYAVFAGKKAAIPKTPYLILLLAIFIVWGADGINSLISEFINRPFLYETTNLTRSITGYGMGMVMATALATLFNMTVWEKNENIPILHHPLQVGVYALLCTGIHLLTVTIHPFLFRFAANLAIFSAITIITLLYTVFWIILLKKENTFRSIQPLGIYLIAGFTTSMTQITLMLIFRNGVL